MRKRARWDRSLYVLRRAKDGPKAEVMRFGRLEIDVGARQVRVEGRRQWMHAAWRRRAEMPLGAAFAAGERAVHAAVATAGLRVVEVRVDPRAVADADVPSDLPPDLSPDLLPDRPRGGPTDLPGAPAR